MARSSIRSIKVYELGLTSYEDVHTLQQRLQGQRRQGAGLDSLLITEHHPVITLGRSHRDPDVRVPLELIRANSIDVVQTERGGNVTYHGPGQLVAYGIIDLKAWDMPVLDYLWALEETVLHVLADWGVQGSRLPAARGVWVNGRKIASVGINVRRWVTMHGIALNIDPNMTHWSMINPCGMPDVEVTSLVREARTAAPMASVVESFVRHFRDILDCAAEQIALPSPRAAAR